MARINFTKVEGAFDRALQKLIVDHLSELAAIANVIHEPPDASNKDIGGIIIRFQQELEKLKRHDSKLYERLSLSSEEEERFASPVDQYEHRDWLRLKELKVRIDELKHELHGRESSDAEHEKQVRRERRRHINKRFNIRDGWLPLH